MGGTREYQCISLYKLIRIEKMHRVLNIPDFTLLRSIDFHGMKRSGAKTEVNDSVRCKKLMYFASHKSFLC